MPEPVQLITTNLLARTIERAQSSPRRRMNHNFHANDESNLHRFLNAMLRGTYVTPHRHASPPKAEGLLVLEGRVAVFVFDDSGTITNCYRLGERGSIGIDVEPGVWHSPVVLSEVAVIYEVKPGPYVPLAEMDFAPFAPREVDAAAPAYLARLLEHAEYSS